MSLLSFQNNYFWDPFLQKQLSQTEIIFPGHLIGTSQSVILLSLLLLGDLVWLRLMYFLEAVGSNASVLIHLWRIQLPFIAKWTELSSLTHRSWVSESNIVLQGSVLYCVFVKVLKCPKVLSSKISFYFRIFLCCQLLRNQRMGRISTQIYSAKTLHSYVRL